MGSPDASVFDSTLTEETTLSFTDSDFYLNLDDVDIGPQIGQGSFSKVYLGRYLGELVAVKKQARNEADLEAYLMRELAVLKHYQHENLLQYIGASNEAASEPGGHSYVFIVTELACGGDLLALLLSEGEVGWKLRVSILTDTARALEFLHRKSLIHRDIKSPNILLDKNHRCKIADFGMTRQLGPNMTVVGTDAYMAPELMFDNPYGTSADMFSFGIVLWETIYRQKAGTEEFIDRRMADGYEVDVQALQDEAPRDANASLVALARELIEQEPDQRPTAEDTLLWLEDLSDVLPDDERAPREPIDYEALFPLDVRKRGGRQKRVAEPKETAVPPAQSPMAPPAPLAASPVAPPVAPLAPSPVVTSSAVPSPAMRLPPKSASRSSGMLAGDTPEPASALARAREGTSALPPGVPVDAGYVGRRSTMDTLGFGDGGKIANAAVMKRAASLQRLMPNDSSGDSDDYSDFEMEYMGMNEMFSGNAVPSFSYSHCAPASRAFHRVPESCTHFLFAGCIQGVLRHSHVDAASGSGVYGNVGGFHGGGGGDRGRRPLSGGKASSGGSGGGGVAHPMMGPMHPRTLSSSPSSQGTLGAVPGKGTGGGAGGWGGGGGGTSSATSASPSSNTSSFMGKLVGASHAPITRQGYLHKKGKSGLRNWQKRWFVLEGSKLIWYKDSKSYPREPRGFLELKGCFLAKGENFSWKILSADASAEQDDYNREIATNEAGDMESWLTSLQEEGFKTDVTVDAWLNSLGLGHLAEAFARADYKDCLMIQEMGLTDEDLAYIGVTNPAHRKALKLAARGLVELMLQVEISAFFNFHSELVYRLDSRWRYLRATTYFEFSDFEDLHRRLKGAMKETKFYKMMPPLPQRPGDARGRRIGSIDHARQMARVQQELNMYTQKLVMLVGTKEPFFTVLCGMLDLIPPDPSRLPVKDEFFMQVQSRVQSAAARGVGGGADLGRASRRTPKRDVAREDRGGGRVGAGAGVRAGAGGGAGAGAGGANAGGANGRVGWSVGAGEGQPPTFVTSTSSHSSSKSKRLSGARTNRHGVKASPMSKSSSSSSSSRPS